MNGQDLKAYRERSGLTQTELGELLSLSLRQIQDMEGSPAPMAPHRLQQLERVSLALAIRRLNQELVLPSIRRDMLLFSAMSGGKAPPPPAGMVYVHGFKVFDATKGEVVRAPRRATPEGVKMARGDVIPGDAELVPLEALDGNGFVKKVERKPMVRII